MVDKLLSATNSGVAEAFYLMNPDKYMVFDSESYYLGNNNISQPAPQLPNIPLVVRRNNTVNEVRGAPENIPYNPNTNRVIQIQPRQR